MAEQSSSDLRASTEDSEEFTSRLYAEESGDNYKRNYLSGYDRRVLDVYLPKLDFLKDVLAEREAGAFDRCRLRCRSLRREYLEKDFDLNVVGEWWFGTDFVDL